MEFVPLLVMSAAVKKLVDFVKYVLNVDVNAAVTQLTAWGSGVIVTAVGAHSDWASTLNINGHTLDTLNGWSQVLVGFVIASTAGVGWDSIKALDNTNSSIVPNLLGQLPVRQGVEGDTVGVVNPPPQP